MIVYNVQYIVSVQCESADVVFINMYFHTIFFQDKEENQELQNACSSVLVTLSRKYCTTVLDCVLQKYQPGTTPHPCVIKTLAHIANANGWRNIKLNCNIQIKEL